MGAADIRGVQSTGVMAQVKHLAAYNQETNRGLGGPQVNVNVSKKALQEIYLPAFQDAVQQGAAAISRLSDEASGARILRSARNAVRILPVTRPRRGSASRP